MMLTKESSSSSKAKDEISAIGAKHINLAEPVVYQPDTQVAKLAQRGIIVREPMSQEQLAKEVVLEGKGKKKLKKAPAAPFRYSTPSPIRRAQREAEENKLRERAWLQKQRNLATRLELQN